MGRPILSVTGGLEGSVLEALAGVFGSTARGDGDDQSDIDLLVVTKSVVGDALGELCASVERWTGNVCRAVVLSPAELSSTRRQNPELFEAWRNDLVILVGERTQLTGATHRGKKGSAHRSTGRLEGDKGF